MSLLTPEERDDLVERIAQAVMDRIAAREQVNRLADFVVERILVLEREQRNNGASPSSQVSPLNTPEKPPVKSN